MTPPSLIVALATRINCVILALGEPVFLAPIVCDHGAEHGALVVRRDAPNHHAVCARRLVTRKRPGFENWELQVRLLGVREGEVLVI